ncbi:serine hydrolase domain-containing protein [Streptomyces mobaraensis]|uniref:serine hydrolase domain-containing protein n=1 Tax=Streptomyces mobaraensis TaxID=35621 RepID=UPI003326B24A
MAAAITVGRDGRGYTLCTGFSSLARRSPLTPTAPFEVGSVSKTFTALLFAVLVEEGRLSLREPLADHVPPGAMPPGPAARRITALHLATHSSGLPHLAPRMLLRALPTYVTNPYLHYRDRDLLLDLSRARLKFPPGTSRHYSNIGFALLGRMLEHVTGQRYAHLVADKIAGPLGLTHTTARSDLEQTEGYWHGHLMPPLRTPGFSGAGAIRSSARDLARFLTQHISPDPDLPPALYRALRAVTCTNSPQATTLGWLSRTTAHGDLFFQPGCTRSATTFIGFSPSRRTAVTALVSSGWTLRNSLIQNAYLLLRHYAAHPLDHGAPA